MFLIKEKKNYGNGKVKRGKNARKFGSSVCRSLKFLVLDCLVDFIGVKRVKNIFFKAENKLHLIRGILSHYFELNQDIWQPLAWKLMLKLSYKSQISLDCRNAEIDITSWWKNKRSWEEIFIHSLSSFSFSKFLNFD